MKSVVVLSGGMDSMVALHLVVGLYGSSDVSTITFNYGSKHNDRENKAASDIASLYGVKNTVVYLPFVNELFKSDLLKSGGDVPEGHYEDPIMTRTVVPFRNGIMLSITAGYADSIGAKTVVIGSHNGDRAIYLDCRNEFMTSICDAINKGTHGEIEIHRPFERISKTEIARLGCSLGVRLDISYSCYKGGEIHCGKCGTCVERREAFLLSGCNDPTIYET